MTTGDYLTARDYFDQVLVGKSLNRKVSMPQDANNPANVTFHQLLTTQERRQKNPIYSRPCGLTVVDYIKNPVRVKCHSYYRILSGTSTQRKDANNPSPASAGKSIEEATDGTTHRSRAQGKRRQMIIQAASGSPPHQNHPYEKQIIERCIHNAARKYNLPTGLLKGVIKAESNFQVRAVSHAGAQGLMQLMPETAKELGVDSPFNIEQNIDGGARYLRKMLDKFGGDIKVALAAYNAGPGTVEKYGGQIPPYRETEHYVDRVLKFFKKMA